MYKVDSSSNKANHGLIMGANNLFCGYFLWCFLFPVIGSLSLKPPAEEILNKHLCPNPVLSVTSKLLPSELSKILRVRLQPRTGTHAYFSRLIRPCTFIEDAALSPQRILAAPPSQSENTINNASLIRIQSINLNTSPWNFSTATGECSKFIMFRSWSEYGNGYPVMCGRENFDQFLGPQSVPLILYYHLRDDGMSFPLFHPNYEQLFSPSTLGSRRDQPRSILELKYMLIYYAVRKPGGKWICRLQQYTINQMQEECSSSVSSFGSICGEYQCGELDALYQKKMGGNQGDGTDLFQQQRFILVKSKSQEKYRVRNFLRQKFVPIIFLVILICAYKTYMKAGLRLHQMPVSETRLRRYSSQRHTHHHGRDPFQDIYFDHEVDDNYIPVGLHIPYVEPSSPLGGDGRGGRGPENSSVAGGSSSCMHGKFMTHPTDPPPSYDTLFPPSYNELFHSPSTTESSPNANITTDTKNPKA